MSEPVKLYKGDEEMTVYGPNQARAMIAAGWTLEEPEPVADDVVPDDAILDELMEESEPKAKKGRK